MATGSSALPRVFAGGVWAAGCTAPAFSGTAGSSCRRAKGGEILQASAPVPSASCCPRAAPVTVRLGERRGSSTRTGTPVGSGPCATAVPAPGGAHSAGRLDGASPHAFAGDAPSPACHGPAPVPATRAGHIRSVRGGISRRCGRRCSGIGTDQRQWRIGTGQRGCPSAARARTAAQEAVLTGAGCFLALCCSAGNSRCLVVGCLAQSGQGQVRVSRVRRRPGVTSSVVETRSCACQGSATFRCLPRGGRRAGGGAPLCPVESSAAARGGLLWRVPRRTGPHGARTVTVGGPLFVNAPVNSDLRR